jgi:hypothetical protein
MFSNIILGLFSLIGLLVCLYFAKTILEEIWRASRQAHRLASAQKRMMEMSGNTPPSFFLMWRTYFKSDFFSFYSSKRIGCFELDYNPSIRARAYR